MKLVSKNMSKYLFQWNNLKMKYIKYLFKNNINKVCVRLYEAEFLTSMYINKYVISKIGIAGSCGDPLTWFSSHTPCKKIKFFLT